MKHLTRALWGATAACALAAAAQAETITIATVNNGDMIRMQGLTDEFTKAHPDIELEWVTLEENVLRQRVTTDIATKGGQYDVMTIGTYEVPIAVCRTILWRIFDGHVSHGPDGKGRADHARRADMGPNQRSRRRDDRQRRRSLRHLPARQGRLG